jgi:hypothetical protein
MAGKVELTGSQRAAVAAFRAFLAGPQQVFLLKGAAGTGKTTLVGEFLRLLRAEQQTFSLMAPTGRAAFIIGRKTECQAFTIHRSIYALSQLKSSEDDDSKVQARFKLKSNDDAKDHVYIVDEASMVSDSPSENDAFSFGSGRLLSDLLTYVGRRKVVFVGDYAQLPPVGMNFSPALDGSYLLRVYGLDSLEYMLREVVRQGSASGILRNATRIRDSIESHRFVEFHMEAAEDCHSENDDLLRPYFALSDERPSASAAVVTYSNRQALLYNQQIRRHYYGEGCERILPGELLLVARNNYIHGAELFNGNVVRVTECEADADVERRFVGVRVKGGSGDPVELTFRNVKIAFRTSTGEQEIKVKILDNFVASPEASIGGTLARALMVDFESRLPKEIHDNLSKIKAMLRLPKLTSQQHEACSAYLQRLLNDEYYNALVCKYGYAMTCHKAQGGEWENVFVDMSRMGGTANQDYFRWVYTALTRASGQLWHYRSPEFTFISNLHVEDIQPSANLQVQPYLPEGEDFREAMMRRLQAIARNVDLTVAEDLSRPYQHWLTFTDGAMSRAQLVLWYKAHGYSGKIDTRSSMPKEFDTLCRGLIAQAFVPEEIPFSTPTRPFAQKLHENILVLLHELDIHLLNVTQDQYHDTYHLLTDGRARVEMWYNEKGFYTYMKSISSLGADDAKLQQLIDKFK